LAGEKGAGERVRGKCDFLGGALGHQFSTFGAGTGAKLDEVIGATEGLLIVLDHQKGVAEIAEGGEEVEQAGVVGWVETDAGFIQDIENSGEAAAELGGEAGAAGFAAGEGIHGAIEGKVTEPKFFEEGEAMDDGLAQRIESVGGGPSGSGKVLKKFSRAGNGELAEGGDIVTAPGRASEGHE